MSRLVDLRPFIMPGLGKNIQDGCLVLSTCVQAISRGSRGFSGLGQTRRSGSIGRSGSVDEASPRPKQVNLEREVVAVGVGLRFLELEEGKQVSAIIMEC